LRVFKRSEKLQGLSGRFPDRSAPFDPALLPSGDNRAKMLQSITDKLIGALLLLLVLLEVLAQWRGTPLFYHAAAYTVVPLLVLLAIRTQWARRMFLVVGLGLVVLAFFSHPNDWLEITRASLISSAFIGAFFTALATLRNASGSSGAIEKCGRFLAQQPPGRRYLALTVGGHLFGLLLSYGSLVLLGSLAESNARREPDPELRRHRLRRMLLAVQRGFISTLSWSPLAFAVAISTKLVPGANWAESLLPCLGSAAIVLLTGWALDSIFKPRLSRPPPPPVQMIDSWLTLWPLVALLLLLVASVGSLHFATGVSIVGVVMLVVPLLSAIWILFQNAKGTPLRTLGRRAAAFLSVELPNYRGEIVILLMAGFIGTAGSSLLLPYVAASGIDLTALPGWQVLVGIVWLIPLSGQLGMNPILIVSLFAPLLPEAAAMGVTPADIVLAITAGWSLSGASSPYTATTLLVGALGQVSARHVGLRWNLAYTLLCGSLLSLWVVAVSQLR
jgi:hypothetical protein